MKVFAIIFAVVLAGVNSLPQHENVAGSYGQTRLVTDAIVSAINDAAQQIRDAGLDPVSVDKLESEYALPVPIILSVRGGIEDLLFVGLSNIATNRMSFNILTSRLSFDISLPEILLSIGNAGVDATILGNDLGARVSGRVVITQPRITGEIRVNVGIISGISIRSIDLGVGLGGIESSLNLNINGNDLSDRVNDLIGNKLPASLENVKNELIELLELLAWSVIEELL